VAARRLTLGGVAVLMYHGIGTVIPAGIDERERKYWVSPESFARQLALIRDGGHRVWSLSGAWAPPLDERAAPVVITVDDGRATDYEVAFPRLLAAGVHAEFFVNTATIGQPGYLTWDNVAEMHRAGMSFQSHAHDHVVLPALSSRLLTRQLRISRRVLEDRLGDPVEFLAAPYGLLDRRVLAVARQVGYRAVCTSFAWPARPGRTTVSRIAIYGSTTEHRLGAILARRPSAYLPGLTRTALTYFPRRLLLKIQPQRLGARPQAGAA
jgi:peptidoglycan/xylan/chitin deacetylase (PgdA/CDA1 family)